MQRRKISGKKSKKLVIGNWKMNPATVAHAKRIILATKKTARTLSRTAVVMCPPFLFLPYALPRGGSVKNAKDPGVGAQNVYFEEGGAFTGEVSTQMLADMGLSHVIVGHSERRKMGETSEIVAKKAIATAMTRLAAVVCIGEETRDQEGVYLDFIKEQIKASLAGFPKKLVTDGKLVIAYEPIWAIGAKEAMTPALIHEMSIFIKKVLSDLYGQAEATAVPILYGGSVNFRNAADIVSVGDVDGLLVGRESVNQPGFSELLRAVDMVT
jgi:triosephosphate isomerase